MTGLTPNRVVNETKSISMISSLQACLKMLFFVLELKLQDEQKIPRRFRHSRMRQFLALFDEHSSLIVNIRNLTNSYISPHYHLVIYYLLQNVFCFGKDDAVLEAIHDQLFDHTWD